MITKLTDKQWENIEKKREEHLQMHLNSEPVEFSEVEKSIEFVYKVMDKEKPKVIFYLDSPMACLLAIKLFRGNLGSQLDRQLYSQLSSQLDRQLRRQLYRQLNIQLNRQLYRQLNIQLNIQLRRQLYSQLSSQLDRQLRRQLHSQLSSQLYSQLGSQLDSQLSSQLYSQLGSQLDSQLSSQLDSQLGSQLDSQLSSQLDSQSKKLELSNPGTTTDYFWRSYYSFYQIILEEIFPDRIKDFSLLFDMQTFFKNCPTTYLFDDIAFVSRPPKTKWLDGRLHNEAGKSVEFSDGWGFYSLNGVSVDEYFVVTPKADIDTTRVLSLENAEQRMALIKYIGMEKFLDSFENRTITKKYMDKNYDLVDNSNDYYCEYSLVDIKIEDEYCRFLKMSNFSTNEWHVEGVPNECSTIEHALAWREGEDNYIKPQGVA